MHENTSDDENKRRDKFTRERPERAGDRYFSDRNGAPPDPYERRRDGSGLKRSFPGGPRRDDDIKRPREDENVGGVGLELMLTQRQFATENDISMDAEDLKERYEKYQEEYAKKHRKWFFDQHKNEEWFKEKYHPANKAASTVAKKERAQKRMDIYNKLKDMGFLDTLSLEPKKAKRIVRLMNAVNALLDDGSDETVTAIMNLEVPDSVVDGVKRTGVVFDPEEGMDSDQTVLQNYKTASILIRNIPPTATLEEIQEVCQRSPGFLRVHLLEAQQHQKWARRAVATYKTSVDVKDVCWSINNIKVKNNDLVASIHRDAEERVRLASPLVNHTPCAQKLLYFAAKLVAFFDKHIGLFVPNPEATAEEIHKDLVVGSDLVGESLNPLVQKIKSALPARLMDAALYQRGSQTPDNTDKLFEKDEGVLALLDEVTFYLRVVYSYDLFQFKLFESEDTYPNRLAVFHIRGQDPEANEEGTTIVKKRELRFFEEEFERYLEEAVTVKFVSDANLEKMGKLDPEEAVEELIKSNTVQLSDEKWLCPLSGKKFKGPDFIRKHILSKHMEHAELAKSESLYFNNYLNDPSRPLDRIEDVLELGGDRDRRPAPRFWNRSREFDRSPAPRPRDFAPPPSRRPHVAYRDLDAAPEALEVPNVF